MTIPLKSLITVSLGQGCPKSTSCQQWSRDGHLSKGILDLVHFGQISKNIYILVFLVLSLSKASSNRLLDTLPSSLNKYTYADCMYVNLVT